MTNRPQPPNTVRLKIKDNKSVTRKEILDALEVQYGNLQMVKIISQIYNNKTWYITFRDPYKIEEIVNKTLSIKSQNILMQDANNIVEFEFEFEYAEKASKSFSNRVNRLDEMPDAQGGEEGEDEETMGGDDENKSQNDEKKRRK
jgi:hypothetical protein